MGFIPDVEKIVGMLPKIRNTLFFSATMPPEIRRLADKFLMNPKEISVAPPSTMAATITQGLIMVKHQDGRRPGGGQKEKRDALRRLIKKEAPRNALIFCNRKRDVDVVCKSLNQHGIVASRLHGDMSQPERTETLAKFKSGDIKFVVCSDVAARGLDIPDMSHVFNFDVPIHAEDYVHRIGRTGRAGRPGRALTIATPEDGKYLAAIKEMAGNEIPKYDLNGNAGATPKPANNTAAPSSPGEPAPKESARRERTPAVSPAASTPAGVTPKVAATETPAVVAPVAAGPVKTEPVTKPNPVKKQARPQAKKKPDSDNGEQNNAPVKGLGDHMPAFLMASPPKGKSK